MTILDNRVLMLRTNVFPKSPIAAVYLYGSRSTGTSDVLSDYDFGVLFTPAVSSKRRFNLRMRLYEDIAQTCQIHEEDLDVVDLLEAPLLLQFNIICGRCIYHADESLRVGFEAYVMARYHDEHYYYDRDLQATITKIHKGVYFDRSISYA